MNSTDTMYTTPGGFSYSFSQITIKPGDLGWPCLNILGTINHAHILFI